MEYLIVSAETLEGLVSIVNEYATKNWRAQGGPFVVDKKLWSGKPRKDNGSLVAQAIVKNESCCGGCANGKDEAPC